VPSGSDRTSNVGRPEVVGPACVPSGTSSVLPACRRSRRRRDAARRHRGAAPGSSGFRPSFGVSASRRPPARASRSSCAVRAQDRRLVELGELDRGSSRDRARSTFVIQNRSDARRLRIRVPRRSCTSSSRRSSRRRVRRHAEEVRDVRGVLPDDLDERRLGRLSCQSSRPTVFGITTGSRLPRTAFISACFSRQRARLAGVRLGPNRSSSDGRRRRTTVRRTSGSPTRPRRHRSYVVDQRRTPSGVRSFGTPTTHQDDRPGPSSSP